MSKVLEEFQVKEYMEHATHKWKELSSEREIITALGESHVVWIQKCKELEEMNHDKFVALTELAFALSKENPTIYDAICANNSYLDMLVKRTGSVFK